MSFLVRGDEGPTNIPEGGVPRDIGSTSFSPEMFQAIARAGLEAAREGSFERTGRRRRRGSKNRMAGQTDNLRRSIERGLQSGGGEEFLPEPRRSTTTVYSEGRGREMPRPKARDKFVPSKPTRMTKEEFDKMPRRRTRLAPGMEDLIDRFPTQGDEGKPKRSRSRRSRKKFELPPGSEGVSDRFDEPSELAKTLGGKYRKKTSRSGRLRRSNSSPPPRKATAAEMEERRRNPLGMGQVARF